MRRRRGRAHVVDAREQAAQDRELLVAELLRRAPARATPHGVVDPLDLVQRRAVRERQRRAHGNLHRAQLGEEAVLLEDRLAAPALRAIELDHDVLAALEPDVVDAVLEAGERRAVPRRLEAAALDGVQHPIGGQIVEKFRHRGASLPLALGLLRCRRFSSLVDYLRARLDVTAARAPERERPWVFRTYSGHSSARASNELYRTNLAKGQTGLSVAFDLPTQTGYDADHPLARGEVGKVGVPIGHVDDMTALFDALPLDRMNTSMTINATAAVAAGALRRGRRAPGRRSAKLLQGTTQNDIIKEYLSRGTYIFPPQPSHAADQRHGGLQRRRDSEVEPDQRLLLPPPGSRRDARPGDRLRAGDGGRRARRRQERDPTSRPRRSRASSAASPSS